MLNTRPRMPTGQSGGARLRIVGAVVSEKISILYHSGLCSSRPPKGEGPPPVLWRLMPLWTLPNGGATAFRGRRFDPVRRYHAIIKADPAFSCRIRLLTFLNLPRFLASPRFYKCAARRLSEEVSIMCAGIVIPARNMAANTISERCGPDFFSGTRAGAAIFTSGGVWASTIFADV